MTKKTINKKKAGAATEKDAASIDDVSAEAKESAPDLAPKVEKKSKAVQAEQVEAQKAEQVEALKVEQVEALKAEQVEALKAEQVEAQKAEQVEALEAEQVEALEAEQVEALKAEQVEALEAEQVEALKAEQVEALKAEEVEAQKAEELEAAEIQAPEMQALDKSDTTQDAVATVILRSAFYEDQHKSSFLLFLLIVAINVFVAFGIVYVAGHPPAPQYFPATNDYRLIELHSLRDPTVSDKFVAQWASLAAQRAYNLDYVHWQSQMTDASAYFTDSGWNDFLKSLKDSGNLRSLLDLHLVSVAKVTGSPQIDTQMVVNGRYAWKVSVPMEVVYTGDKTITQTMQLTLIVMRAPAAKYPSRIAINNYIADTQG